MIDRCASDDPRWGGRGITVCTEWMDYEVFRSWAIQAGYALGLSIDRIDNDGNYEPSNCRWATASEQMLNTRRTTRYELWGEIKSLTEWARDPRCMATHAALYLRVTRRKWDFERAVTTSTKTEVNTHCSKGHELMPDNIYGHGASRRCKKCAKDRAEAAYLRRKESGS